MYNEGQALDQLSTGAAAQEAPPSGDMPVAPGGGPLQGGPPQGTPGPGGPGLGGPGIDTAQEKQALQLLTKGAVLLREAATVDPSVRYIIDGILQKGFMDIMKHYGMEQEGKLAMDQAKLQQNNMRVAQRMGPPGPPAATPTV